MLKRILNIAAFIVFFSFKGYCQQVTATEMRAILLFKFPEHITWPNESNLKDFQIAVYNDSVLYSELRNFSKHAKIKGLPVTITQVTNTRNLKNIQILAIGNIENEKIATILQSIKGDPIILISDNCLAQKEVMINLLNYGKKKNQINFEINKKNIAEQGLEVHEELLLLGGTEIDIRELYKKSEASLKEEIKKVEKQQLELDSMKLVIIENKIIISSQNQIVLTQNQRIQKQKDSLISLAKKIEETNFRVSEREQLLIKKEDMLGKLGNEILLKQRIIENQKTNIDSQSNILQLQKQEITIKAKSIEQQKEILDSQKSEITTQYNTILTISALLIVVLIMGMVSFNAFREKRKAYQLLSEKNKKIEEQKEELKTQKDLLEETNKELESFSYSVSHDLRAPLRSINGFSLVLNEDYSEALDENGKKYLDRIRIASQKMDVLIEEILKLSRVQRQELNKTIVNLSEMAQMTFNELQAECNALNISFKVPPDLKVIADHNLIQIVMVNLLNNAIKYSSKTENPQIEINSFYHNDKQTFYVRDNGVGFDMRYYEKLFGAFQRLHTNEEFNGIGIGLSIVKRIINRHGGKIWAESQVGHGATFYFTL